MLLALLLLSLFMLVLLGFYVFVAAPRSRAHQTFAAFIACLAAWTVNDIFMWGFGGTRQSAAVWAGLSFALSLLLQFALVVFAWVFPEDGEVPWRRAAVMFAPGAVLVPAALAGMMWDGLYFDGSDFRIRLTPLAYAFGLYIYGLFAYGFALLFKKWRRNRGTLWGSNSARYSSRSSSLRRSRRSPTSRSRSRAFTRFCPSARSSCSSASSSTHTPSRTSSSSQSSRHSTSSGSSPS